MTCISFVIYLSFCASYCNKVVQENTLHHCSLNFELCSCLCPKAMSSNAVSFSHRNTTFAETPELSVKEKHREWKTCNKLLLYCIAKEKEWGTARLSSSGGPHAPVNSGEWK